MRVEVRQVPHQQANARLPNEPSVCETSNVALELWPLLRCVRPLLVAILKRQTRAGDSVVFVLYGE